MSGIIPGCPKLPEVTLPVGYFSFYYDKQMFPKTGILAIYCNIVNEVTWRTERARLNKQRFG